MIILNNDESMIILEYYNDSDLNHINFNLWKFFDKRIENISLYDIWTLSDNNNIVVDQQP